MKFSIKDFFSKYGQIWFSADLDTFAEETLNGKPHFFVQWMRQILVPNNIMFYNLEPLDF